ncbi:acyltransferase [Riemerella anatipestifer]|nr:acyltransferase [Riemerella anatipestifer]MDY3534308.1 acyltransferase [Riemerella anatipestifer]MDY3535721.1 acyltransferase [Riemerella anatipestifer]
MNTSQLTFTRFIVAVLLVFFHYHHNKIFVTNFDFIEKLKPHLNLGVSYFYVLSGFVMMLAYGNRSYVSSKEYYINRIARIYPLHILSLALVIMVSLLISIRYIEFYHFPDISFILKNIFLVQSWFPQSALTLNYPSWSISVELFFYLCFPVLFNFFINKNHIKVVAPIIILFWLASQVLMNLFYLSPSYNDTIEGGKDFSIEHLFLFYNPLFHLNQFCIGLLFGKYFINNYQKVKNNYDIAIIVVFTVTCIMVYCFRDLLVHNGLIAVNFAVLIFFISANEGKITRLFRKKIFVYLGEISFAIYLLQKPVFDVTEKAFRVLHIVNPYLIFFSSLFVLIVCSHYTYQWVEIPCKEKIKRYFKK